jgi:glutamate 5-kinase
MNGDDVGTVFLSDTSTDFDIIDFIKNKKYLDR